MSPVNYSIYLVTDSGLLPEGISLENQVRKCLEGGVKIVQLREKHAETRDFIQLAKRIHAITREFNVPLLINDRLDVAQAIDAEGIHVGQDDIDVETIRRVWGENKIIGVSVSSVEEAQKALEAKVDYVGIGAVFGTKTKDLKKKPLGCYNFRKILRVFAETDVSAVAIGGINESNVRMLRHLVDGGRPGRGLDGIAVVSCLIGSRDAKAAAEKLASLWARKLPWPAQRPSLRNETTVLREALMLIGETREIHPLVHHMTNPVVKNFSANVTLAAGGSPVMSECAEEFGDLAGVDHSGLLVNMGSPTAEGMKLYLSALKEYNKRGKPTVLDPVGAGASEFRRQAVAELLDNAVYSVIKGNVGEIAAAVKEPGFEMRGVDSAEPDNRGLVETMAIELAYSHRCVVVVTGKVDLITDGIYSVSVSHGHRYLSLITGSGCVLGSLITTLVAANPEKPFAAALGAVLLLTRAAEKVAEFSEVSGPGSFVPALIDAIYATSKNMDSDMADFSRHCKVEGFF